MKYLYVGATPDLDDQEVFAAVGVRLAEAFATPVKETEVPPIEFAFDPRRNQWGSIPVLGMLAREAPPDAARLIAVTSRDLFIPVLTFVYGHAQLNGRVAVVSVARLRQEFYGLPPNREVLVERAVKGALHEAGHTFGLVHCADPGCVMALATNIRQIDAKHAGFCPACSRR